MRFSQASLNRNYGTNTHWGSQLKDVLQDVSLDDMRDLQYNPLTYKFLQNIDYGTLYIIKHDYASGKWNKHYWGLVKIEDAYSLIHLQFVNEGWRGTSGMSTWSQEEVDYIEQAKRGMGPISFDMDTSIVKFGLSFSGFMNWVNVNPFEVK